MEREVKSYGFHQEHYNGSLTALCLDATDTQRKCGLLPSELLKQRDELLRVMGHMIRLMEDSEYATVNQQTALHLAKEAVKSTEQ